MDRRELHRPYDGMQRPDMGGQNNRFNQNGTGIPAETASNTVSPEAWILTGISALVLLAGIFIAWKVRH